MDLVWQCYLFHLYFHWIASLTVPDWFGVCIRSIHGHTVLTLLSRRKIHQCTYCLHLYISCMVCLVRGIYYPVFWRYTCIYIFQKSLENSIFLNKDSFIKLYHNIHYLHPNGQVQFAWISKKNCHCKEIEVYDISPNTLSTPLANQITGYSML